MSAVTVHLFASYAESFGVSQIKIELPPQSRVADLITQLQSLPGAYTLPPSPRVAVNRKFASLDHPIESTDEIALIPPVAGG